MWKRLAHPNIVPFLGVTLEPLQLISAWVSGEELRDYISNHPDTDRLGLVGVPLPLCRITLTHFPAMWYRSRPQLPPLPQRGSRGAQGGK